MEIKIIKSVKDDFCEQSGPSTVTHAFLSLDSMLFELGRFYVGPHMNRETGERLEKIEQFEKCVGNFNLQAAKDGLWLHCPKINGIQKSINLFQPDKEKLEKMLKELWSELRDTRPPIK